MWILCLLLYNTVYFLSLLWFDCECLIIYHIHCNFLLHWAMTFSSGLTWSSYTRFQSTHITSYQKMHTLEFVFEDDEDDNITYEVPKDQDENLEAPDTLNTPTQSRKWVIFSLWCDVFIYLNQVNVCVVSYQLRYVMYIVVWSDNPNVCISRCVEQSVLKHAQLSIWGKILMMMMLILLLLFFIYD